MKKIIIPFVLCLVGSFFMACNGGKTIKVTSVPSHNNNTTQTKNSDKQPNEGVEKEERLEGYVQFVKGDNLEGAIALAKAEKKPVFIDFYADWCAPCKVLEESVFRDYDVAEYMNKNVISIRVNIEKGKGASLKEQMYVRVLPTLLFLDSNGDEIARKEALPLIEEFKKMMKTAVWKVKNPSGQP
jgi:thiol:disulfide interchange protein